MAKDRLMVFGVFTCGCNFDPTPSSLELVSCESPEAELVAERMRQHSVSHQCHPCSAISIALTESFVYASGTPPVSFFHTYADYVKAWSERHIEDVGPVVQIPAPVNEGEHGKAL